MPDEIGDRIHDSLVVSDFQGGTRHVRLDGNRSFVGFVGDVTFDVCTGMRSRSDIIAAFGSLAGLARYCGTGVETMRGMGQIRLLAGRKEEKDRV
jgi:CRISPR/Cas system endoribonuclease Cas6 (RAMP superfamily)